MNKKSIAALALSVLAIGLLVYTQSPIQAAVQPGDAGDPLVTRRYVDSRIAELSAQIARLEAALAGGQTIQQAPGAPPPADGAPPAGATVDAADELLMEVLRLMEERGYLGAGQVVPFSIYSVPQGQILFFEAGAEFVLRSGSVSAITGPNGFVDVTAGRDVLHGETISHNHLHLVPATDGRGLMFNTSGWIMIKGGYRVAG